MTSLLITGCNRGIGFEFVKQLLSHPKPPAILIGTCRKPADAHDLQALAKQHSSLHILQLDVLNFDGYEAFSLKVKEIVGEKGLNVLINNAGILIRHKNTLSEMNVKDMSDTFLTNSIAPVMLIKTLHPLLKLAADFNQNLPMGFSRAAIVNISSGLGSLTNNTIGTYLEYRESKAALNMTTRSLTVELLPQNIFILNLHPGWVQTDMGTSAAAVKVQDSVEGMIKVIDSSKPEQHGHFIQYNGEALPW